VQIVEKPAVPSVMAAINILHMLKEQRESGLRLAEIYRGLGLPKSTVFNVLKTLRQADLISMDPLTRRYHLGWGLAILGAAAAAATNFIAVTRSYLKPFAQKTGLACIVARRTGEELVVVDSIEAAGYVSLAVPTGSSWPLHFGSQGKVFLAYLPPDELESYLATRELVPYTTRTITDVEALKRELARVRASGVAVNVEEYTLGVNSVAVPVFGPGGEIAVTLSALDFAPTLSSDRLGEVGRELKTIADRITVALGGRYPPRLAPC